MGSSFQALRIHSKCSKKHMSMKQIKKCGLFILTQEIQKFDIYKTMHEMWNGYIAQLLKNTGKNQLAQCLLSADLHGAIITVTECKILSLTGTYGIMIRETAETFGIITRDDKFQGFLQLYPKSCLYLSSKLIAGRLLCMATNSLLENLGYLRGVHFSSVF